MPESLLPHLCLRLETLLKKPLWHRSFPVNFEKFFLQKKNTSGGCFHNGKSSAYCSHGRTKIFIDFQIYIIVLLKVSSTVCNCHCSGSRSSHQRCSLKKGVLNNIAKFTRKHLCGTKVSFLIKLQAWTCNFIKKEALAQAFSCEFCDIFKNIFFTEHLWTTASEK